MDFCEHDYRIDHEFVVCILCGKVKSELLTESFNRPQTYDYRYQYYVTEHLIKDQRMNYYEVSGTIIKNLNIIYDILDRFHISKELSFKIMPYFSKMKIKYPQYKKYDLLIYSIYLTLRKYGYQIQVNEVAENSNIKLKKLIKLENSIEESIPLIDQNYRLNYYCTLFDITYKNQKRIYENIKRDYDNPSLNMSTPDTILLSNIFIFLKSTNSVTLRKFAHLSGAKAGTIYNFMRKKEQIV